MAERYVATQKFHRSGAFNGQHVHAWRYETVHGNLAWHVSMWPQSGNPIDDYWVEGEEFFEMLHFHRPLNGPISIEIGRRIVGLDREKRDTVLTALTKWEKEEQEHA